jgi:hypothetical protein
MPDADRAGCDAPPAFLPARPITQADLAALTERVWCRVVRWFRTQRLLVAAAAADMLAWENSGFSVDASVRITLIDRDVPSYFQSLEHLLRYCARPPFALERLFVTRDASGLITRVRYVLPRHKAANWVGPGRGRKYTRPGAGGVVELSPFEFLDQLADLVPPPRKHRHRYHGAFAPILANRSSRHRSQPPGAHRPTGASSCRPMTIATSFNPRPTSCQRSTSTASDRCRTRGINEAVRWPASERLRVDAGKTPVQGVKQPFRERLFGAGKTGPSAHEPLISPETVAEVPLTGLWFCPRPAGVLRRHRARLPLPSRGCLPAVIHNRRSECGGP